MSDLDIKVRARLEDYISSGMDKARSATAKLTSELSRQNIEAKKLSYGAGELAGKFINLKNILISYGAIKIGSYFLDAASSAEKFRVQFEVLLGSAEKARARIAEYQQFAAVTPFELQGVVKAGKILQTFGGEVLSTGKYLKMVGDMAATADQPFEDIAVWVGRAYDAMQSGRPFGEAAMRLQELALLSGSARGRLEAMQKAGASGAEMWKFFTNEMSRFNGMMDKQSRTWAGLMSTMSDNFKQAAQQIMDAGLFDYLKSNLQELTDWFANNKQEIADFAKAVGGGARAIAGVTGSAVAGAGNISTMMKSGDFGLMAKQAISAKGLTPGEHLRLLKEAQHKVEARYVEYAKEEGQKYDAIEAIRVKMMQLESQLLPSSGGSISSESKAAITHVMRSGLTSKTVAPIASEDKKSSSQFKNWLSGEMQRQSDDADAARKAALDRIVSDETKKQEAVLEVNRKYAEQFREMYLTRDLQERASLEEKQALEREMYAKHLTDLSTLDNAHRLERENLEKEQQQRHLANIEIRKRREKSEQEEKSRLKASMVSDSARAFNSLLGEERKFSTGRKRIAQGVALVDTFTAAQMAFKNGQSIGGIPGIILGGIAMAAAIATGLSNVAQIEKQKFATGGLFKGSGIVPGSKYPKDTVNASLTGGEMTLTEDQQVNLFNMIKAGNRGESITVHLYDNSGRMSETIAAELRNGNGQRLVDEIVRLTR